MPFVAVAHHEVTGTWTLPAEVSTTTGNARSIALQILSRLPPPELELQQRSFSYGDGHTFRIATQGAVATLCLERGLGSAASFEMLSRVRKSWRDCPAGAGCNDALETLTLDAIAEHTRQQTFSSADEELGQVSCVHDAALAPTSHVLRSVTGDPPEGAARADGAGGQHREGARARREDRLADTEVGESRHAGV